MFAQEVHGREVQRAAAGGAAAGLEDRGLFAELAEFGLARAGFGCVGGYEAAVLWVQTGARNELTRALALHSREHSANPSAAKIRDGMAKGSWGMQPRNVTHRQGRGRPGVGTRRNR